MIDDKYNGWTNRETWAAALWIDNDPDTYEHRNELCSAAKSSKAIDTAFSPSGWSIPRDPEFILADSLRVWVESMAEEFYAEPAKNAGLGNMFSDLGSIWRINYNEIAKNWLEDFEDDAAA